MSAHDFNSIDENQQLCSGLIGQRALHVLRRVGIRATDAFSSTARLQRLRASLSGQLPIARFLLSRSVLVHGVCTAHVSRELARHRDLFAIAATEVVSRRLSRTGLAEPLGR